VSNSLIKKRQKPWRLFSWPRVGVVDVGSNAIRVTVAEITTNEIREFVSKRFALRLGEDVFKNGRILSSRTQTNLIDVFSQIQNIFIENGVDLYRAVATSALRSARNRKKILNKLRKKTGIHLELIAASEEERLIGYSLPEYAKKGKSLLMDLGGGSLEIGAYHRSFLDGMSTLPLGAVRLLSFHSSMAKNSVQLCEHIARVCEQDRFFKDFVNTKHSSLRVVGSGGNIRALYRVSRKMFRKKTTLIPRLKVDELSLIIQKLEKMSPRQRQNKFKLPSDRADVILPAAYVFYEILNYLNLKNIDVPSGVSLRRGILLDLQRELF
jgi:exopolyphosphatase/guanosine-5'-triphosphate,3'-diphosphate pyrophosphatase